MSTSKIRRDDDVVVLRGRDRGKRGRVVRVLADGRALVSGVNMVKRHTKPNPSINRPGGIKDQEAPIHLSNLAIYNAATERADYARIRVDDDGRRVRVFKSDGREIGK